MSVLRGPKTTTWLAASSDKKYLLVLQMKRGNNRKQALVVRVVAGEIEGFDARTSCTRASARAAWDSALKLDTALVGTREEAAVLCAEFKRLSAVPIHKVIPRSRFEENPSRILFDLLAAEANQPADAAEPQLDVQPLLDAAEQLEDAAHAVPEKDPLTAEQRSFFDSIVAGKNALGRDTVASFGFRDFGTIDVTWTHLACLRPGVELNAEVVNFYLGLLNRREQRSGRPRVYIFETFFVNELYKDTSLYAYDKVNLWADRVNFSILDCEMVIFPVHTPYQLSAYWALACVNLIQRNIFYLDSSGGQDASCMRNILHFIEDLARDKDRPEFFSARKWPFLTLNVPRHSDFANCGVFMLKFADSLARNVFPFTFGDGNIATFRAEISWEILHQEVG